ncbi:MAG: NUMOD4 motif-containing HNH endonuclease [Pyrinomonadaceae bacterium]
MCEEWLAIPGYEGRYEAATSGRIRNAKTGRVLRHAVSKDGYCFIALSKDGTCRSFTVHKLIALTFIGPRPEGQTVNHRDLNKENNALANLEYITHQENVGHAKTGGRFKINRPRGSEHGTHTKPETVRRGERATCVKLTEQTVCEIRSRWDNRWLGSEKITKRKLAAEYGVSDALIGMIIRREVWTHV